MGLSFSLFINKGLLWARYSQESLEHVVTEIRHHSSTLGIYSVEDMETLITCPHRVVSFETEVCLKLCGSTEERDKFSA